MLVTEGMFKLPDANCVVKQTVRYLVQLRGCYAG